MQNCYNHYGHNEQDIMIDRKCGTGHDPDAPLSEAINVLQIYMAEEAAQEGHGEEHSGHYQKQNVTYKSYAHQGNCSMALVPAKCTSPTEPRE